MTQGSSSNALTRLVSAVATTDSCPYLKSSLRARRGQKCYAVVVPAFQLWKFGHDGVRRS